MSRILVIDDEQSILYALKESLDVFGYDVQIAVDGKEGIERFEKGPFDVVITDINMPNLDGIGVAKHIRKSKRPSTPIIALTGASFLIGGDADAFNKVLEKPFMIQSLADTVKELIRT